MTFAFAIPKSDGSQTDIHLEAGDCLFILGANGVGKSALLQQFASNTASIRKISASRQNWFQSNTLEFSPTQKKNYENQAQNWARNPASRFQEQNPQFRTSLAIYDLIDADNEDAKAIAKKLREGDPEGAVELANKTPPIGKINELLAQSNIEVSVSVIEGGQLMASKGGSGQFSAAQLSDGERNALLIAAEVLTSPAGSLIIIDEPERHLHRSISSPLLGHLFRHRNDCAFVVGTHELLLALDKPDSQTLLVRDCVVERNQVTKWSVDLLPEFADIDDTFKLDILGSRQRILFVEGQTSSLDNPIYSLLFPGCSVRPKGSSRDVMTAARGVRSTGDMHWVQAWGLIDNDGRTTDEIHSLASEGIFALPCYSIESVYYHPILIAAVAERQAQVDGSDGKENAQSAFEVGTKNVADHLERLAVRHVEKKIRGQIQGGMPTQKQIQSRIPIELKVDTSAILNAEIERISVAIDSGNWDEIVQRYPVRETPALDAISKALGLQNRHHYEAAVLSALRGDAELLTHVRSLFGELEKTLNGTDNDAQEDTSEMLKA